VQTTASAFDGHRQLDGDEPMTGECKVGAWRRLGRDAKTNSAASVKRVANAEPLMRRIDRPAVGHSGQPFRCSAMVPADSQRADWTPADQATMKARKLTIALRCIFVSGDVATMEEVDDVLRFWFGERFDEIDDSKIAGRQSKLWWGKSADADAEIRERFEARVRAAGAGELDDWRQAPEGTLALILLTDQLTRNIYRGSRAMFGSDAVARKLCIEGLKAGSDAALRPIQRVFFYLPLEHSEDVDLQAWCVDLMRGLARGAPEDQREIFEGFVRYAQAHQRIIERFGRFPHRNAVLSRESTAEELEFLKQPGSSF
jgi:uncharacterized protein (DUF924 family)